MSYYVLVDEMSENCLLDVRHLASQWKNGNEWLFYSKRRIELRGLDHSLRLFLILFHTSSENHEIGRSLRDVLSEKPDFFETPLFLFYSLLLFCHDDLFD